MKQLRFVAILAILALILAGCTRFSDRIESMPSSDQTEAPAPSEETPISEGQEAEPIEEQSTEIRTEDETEPEGEIESEDAVAEPADDTSEGEEDINAVTENETDPMTVPSEPIIIDMSTIPSMTLDEGWEQIYSLDVGYPFELTITEEQLKTAFIENADLSEISDINVSLDDGLITLSFTIQLEHIAPEAEIVLAPSVVDGNVDLTVQSVTVGAFTLPEEIVEEISAALQMAMNGAREEIASQYPVKANVTLVTVDNGTMTIAGTLVPDV